MTRIAPLVSMVFLLAPLALSSVGCSTSTECDEGDCVCMGACACLPGDELTEDFLDVRPLFTVDGLPVVVLRLDMAGTCIGSGERAYIVYRTTVLEITTGPVDVDDFRTPRNVPGSFAYEYADLSIEVRDIAATGVRLTFVDAMGESLVAECDGSSGVISCAEL